MQALKTHILNDERKQILPSLGVWKDEYYLAGGTALALQIGHRDCVINNPGREKHTCCLG